MIDKMATPNYWNKNQLFKAVTLGMQALAVFYVGDMRFWKSRTTMPIFTSNEFLEEWLNQNYVCNNCDKFARVNQGFQVGGGANIRFW